MEILSEDRLTSFDVESLWSRRSLLPKDVTMDHLECCISNSAKKKNRFFSYRFSYRKCKEKALTLVKVHRWHLHHNMRWKKKNSNSTCFSVQITNHFSYRHIEVWWVWAFTLFFIFLFFQSCHYSNTILSFFNIITTVSFFGRKAYDVLVIKKFIYRISSDHLVSLRDKVWRSDINIFTLDVCSEFSTRFNKWRKAFLEKLSLINVVSISKKPLSSYSKRCKIWKQIYIFIVFWNPLVKA